MSCQKGARHLKPVSSPIPPGKVPFYGRAKTPRTRSGCLCCRQRKVKCDEQRPSCQRCRHIGKTCVYGLRLTWLAEKVQSLLNMPSGVEWARNEHTRPASTGTAFLNTTWSDLHGHFNGEACNMRYSSNSNEYSNREICYAIMGCEGSSSPSLLLSIPSQLASYSTHEYRIPKSLNGPRPNLSSADMAIFDFYVNKM